MAAKSASVSNFFKLSIFVIFLMGPFFSSCFKNAERGVRLPVVYASLLSEMMQVIFLEQPKNEVEFQAYLNALVQGASLEGIHNGFTHSQGYRKLEHSKKRAKEAVLKFFLVELKAIQNSRHKPTSFGLRSGLPPAEFNREEFELEATESRKGARDPKGQLSVEVIFKYSNFFTLKRVLTQEVLQLIEEKSKDSVELIEWFGKWSAHVGELGVDFGLPDRNLASEEFHREWARRTLQWGEPRGPAFKEPRGEGKNWDRVKWEVLNKIHRVMNHLQDYELKR